MRKFSMSPRASRAIDVSHKKKIHSGYLYKQGTMFNKKFQKRFFVLFEGRILVYYASEFATTESNGQINLSEVIALNESDLQIKDENIYQHAFEVTTKDRTYILTASDTKSMHTWMDYIRSSVFGTVIHSGWLTKEGQVVKSWKRRYFVLTNTKLLRYFEDEEQTKFKGAINVQSISSIKEGDAVEPYWNFMIHLQTSDRLYLLNADSEAKRQEWIKMLNEGKKAINYDAGASLFVDISQEHNISQSVECKVNERIKYILELYTKWCQSNEQFEEKQTLSPKSGILSASGTAKGIYEIINNDLKDYNNVQLMNDFDFILNNFGNDRSKYLDLVKFILGKDKNAPSVPAEKSLILMRNYRDRVFYAKYDSQRKLLFNDSEDVNEINTQCLLDRIYSFILYSYNTVILGPVEWGRIKDYDETDKLITSKQMLNEKKKWMKNAQKLYRINDRANKFMINVRSEPHKENNKEMTVHNVFDDEDNENKDTEDQKENEEDEEEKLFECPSEYNRIEVSYKNNEFFEFGTAEFLYWDSNKESDWYIGKKYESLKEEILQNKACPISVQQFDDLYASASILSESNAPSQYSSYEGLEDTSDDVSLDTQPYVEKYGIYEFTPIKMNHIISLLLYCNYYQMQQVLLSTYAPNLESNESIKEWKLRHAEFAIWAKYLRECVEVFGKRTSQKDLFYFCINSDEIEFCKTLNVCMNVPLSMTRNMFVAQSYFEFDEGYDDKTGMLLAVTKQSNADVLYMDCGWCSDFPQEKEVLVLCGYPNQARIASMVHVSYKNDEMLFVNYQYYMSAIDDLERMIHAQQSSDFIDRKTKNALQKMIKDSFGENENENKEDDEKEKPMKEIRISSAFGSSDLSPKFAINITSPSNDMKALNVDTDKNNEKKEDTASSPSTPTKVIVTGPKGQKEPKSPKKVTKDIVFQLKAKRKEKVPVYIGNMFDEYCISVKNVTIDMKKMVSLKGGYRKWKDVFLQSNDSNIKMDIFVRLFPNLSHMQIHYVPQAFTKQTVKNLIAFLKSEHVKGREIEFSIFRPDIQSNFDEDNKGANIEMFTLDNAMEKYLCKASKIGKDFHWVCRLKEKEIDSDIPCIQIMRPQKATERNKDLSNILSESQVNILMDLLKEEMTKKQPKIANNFFLKSLFHAKEDGFDSSEFHKVCDGIAHTVTIVQSTNKCIFAAYSSKTWGRTGKWIHDEFAFLIPIKSNDESSKPRVVNIRSGHEQYGLYLQTNGGPAFGKGDIKILSNADKSSRNQCNSNSFAFNTKPNELVGGEGSYFMVADYEVFQAAFY